MPFYPNFMVPVFVFGLALLNEWMKCVTTLARQRDRQSSLVQQNWPRQVRGFPVPAEPAYARANLPFMTLNTISQHSSGSGVFPALVFVQGSEQKNIVLNRTPFTVGRKVDKDLVIADPRVSRDHAQIMQEGQEFFLVDLGSKHGTFVNGERIQRQKLERGDRLEFGARDSAYILFNPAHATSNTAREFLSQISGIQIKPEATDLEKLTLFLEAARKLNTAGVLDEILITMLDVTLQLTRAERGYVFLKDEEGKLRLAAGRNSKKEPLLDDKTISHSILEESMRSNSEFLLTDTSQSLDLAGRQSIVAYDLRTVVCIPLRKMQVQATRDAQTPAPGRKSGAQAMGVSVRGFALCFARYQRRGPGHSARDRDRSRVADRECPTGAGRRRSAALPAGVEYCGQHSAAADAGENSRGSLRATARQEPVL